MAKTAKQIAKAEKKTAQRKKGNAQDRIDSFKAAMGGKVDRSKLSAKQERSFDKALADRVTHSNTVRTANIAISSATKAENIVERHQDDPEEALRLLRVAREKEMDVRGGLLVDPERKGKQFEKGGAFDYGLAAQAYGDAMRAITGRQMGEGTPYTGPGATISLDEEGRPRLTTEDIGGTPKGSVIYDVDPEAYIRRFRPKFQPTQEQIERRGGPGGWVGGLLQGADAGYLTPWQQTNFQWMLEDADRGILGDAGEFAKLPSDWRSDWRTETWGDQWNEATGRWERAEDPTLREAAVADQIRRYNEGLFNPYTGQPVGGTGTEPWPDQGVTFPWNQPDSSNLNNTLNRTPGSAFVHPYAADPYTVPHMQTGAGWEGLGAEYQPGTVEGLGLIAGDAYAPYEPLARGLLDARPDFMGTPSQFTPIDFKGGLGGDTTNTDTNTNSGAWTPTWQIGPNNQWGWYDVNQKWNPGAGAVAAKNFAAKQGQ